MAKTIIGLSPLSVPAFFKNREVYSEVYKIAKAAAGSGSGGAGTGVIDNGSQYRLAYYAATGTTISPAAAITGSRALVSNSNGVPTHSAVTATELGYLGGVTSGLQAQIDAKQAGGAYLTVGNSLSDIGSASLGRTNLGSGTVGDNIYTLDGVGAVGFIRINANDTVTQRTAAELKTDLSLNNVDNTADAAKPVSTATQTALDAKLDKSVTINTQSASYTLVIGDAGKLVEINNASANNLTVPPNSSVAFPTGTQILISQYGAGQTTVVAGGGVTIRSTGGNLKLSGQYAGATLIKRGTDEWLLMGDLTA